VLSRGSEAAPRTGEGFGGCTPFSHALLTCNATGPTRANTPSEINEIGRVVQCVGWGDFSASCRCCLIPVSHPPRKFRRAGTQRNWVNCLTCSSGISIVLVFLRRSTVALQVANTGGSGEGLQKYYFGSISCPPSSSWLFSLRFGT